MFVSSFDFFPPLVGIKLCSAEYVGYVFDSV